MLDRAIMNHPWILIIIPIVVTLYVLFLVRIYTNGRKTAKNNHFPYNKIKRK